ncbi:MAG: adenylate/guanylate cyclase domain-containing protein [Acidimicrobiales bacterium]
MRRALARKAADLIRSDPGEADRALEMGIVDRKWLDHPGERPVSTSTPVEIVERFLERAVEQRPSRLTSLGLTAVQLLATHGPSSGGGDPKLTTVVFTDLEGFTAYTDTHGDTAAVALIEEHRLNAGPVVRRWSGRIVKTLGDGLLCTFPDAESGVCAALELLGTAPTPLRLRAGVHCGEAMVTRGDVMGQVVNVAARITETAKGGEVLVSAGIAALLGDVPKIRLGKVKSRRLKGVTDRVGICTAI